MDEGDVNSALFRRNSSPRRSLRSWTTQSTPSSGSRRTRRRRKSEPSITNKKPMPISTTSSISSSGASANSTNPSSIQSPGSSCRTTGLASTPAVFELWCSDGLERPQQRRSGQPAEIGRSQHRGAHHLRHADLIVWFHWKICLWKYQEVIKLECSSLSTFIATFRFSIDALSCYSNSFFTSLFLRMSIVISSVFWQHSRTARTIVDIVEEFRSQFYRFRSTDDKLLSFSRQQAR